MEIRYFGWTRQEATMPNIHLCENVTHHVDKTDNPVNLPEARPIEDFWSILKDKVYVDNSEANN